MSERRGGGGGVKFSLSFFCITSRGQKQAISLYPFSLPFLLFHGIIVLFFSLLESYSPIAPLRRASAAASSLSAPPPLEVRILLLLFLLLLLLLLLLLPPTRGSPLGGERDAEGGGAEEATRATATVVPEAATRSNFGGLIAPGVAAAPESARFISATARD